MRIAGKEYPENGEKAIVLASGGAKVAYEAALLYVMKASGWAPKYVLGVSAGAISGAAYAMGRIDQMVKILYDLDTADVHKKRSIAAILWRLAMWRVTGKPLEGLHDNAPLLAILRRELENYRVRNEIEFRAGRVNLVDGSYVSQTFRDGHRAWHQVAASATIPVYWPPAADPSNPGRWVDGGVRNMAPLGDLFDMERESTAGLIGQVLVIGTEALSYRGSDRKGIIDIALTAGSIALKEILINDIDQWRMINDILIQVEAQSPTTTILHPSNRRSLRAVELVVHEPTSSLGKGSDFTREHFRELLVKGEADGIRIFFGEKAPASYVPIASMIAGTK